MPNIHDAFPSNYLKASDLQGRNLVVTIDRVEFEAVGRNKERKAVIYFVGKQKGVVLNKTNANKITDITGSALTEEWAGHAIVLYPSETEFQGETVECIRVKPVGTTKGGGTRMTPNAPEPKRKAVKPEPEPDDHDDDRIHSAPLTDDDIPFMWVLPLALSLLPLTWLVA